MNPFPGKAQATRLAFDENSFSVFLADGRTLSLPLVFFPRLLQADKRRLPSEARAMCPAVPKRDPRARDGSGCKAHDDPANEATWWSPQ